MTTAKPDQHKQNRLPLEELERMLRNDPGQLLRGYQSDHYDWPAEYSYPEVRGMLMADMYFSWGERQHVGYVQCLQIRGTVAEVAHFAVAKELEGKGCARPLAFWLARELRSRYKITAILFAESDGHTSYPKFFKSLGAVPAPDPEPKITRPAFLWDITPAGGNVP